ncbi:MAG: LemA family protein [Prevotella sp.]|nr:LemA family protein [Prevotella sp.]
MGALTGILIVIIALAVIVVMYIIKTQRELVSLDELCKNALSQIAVQLNSRWDALMNLAKMAAQYSKHESETLINVIKQRRQSDISTPEQVNEQQGALQQVLGRLIAVGEAYPDLKAADLFRETMDGVKQYEENVRMSRMVYNDTATKMNRMVRQWPSSFVASMLNFREKDYLKVDEEQKSKAPDLNEVFEKKDA